jgi:hypothetical protein
MVSFKTLAAAVLLSATAATPRIFLHPHLRRRLIRKT